MPLRSPAELAREMFAAFRAVSPLIERYTAEVCPGCAHVCCIDRHGTPEPLDLAFLDALGENPRPEPPLADDTLPCRHLGERGCTVERWRRPYRCTWYFCPPLLDQMPRAAGGRAYRDLVDALGALQRLRAELAGLLGEGACYSP